MPTSPSRKVIFPQVQRNDAKRTLLKVEVRLPDEPDKPMSGQLTFLDNAVQSSSGTVMLRATVPNRRAPSLAGPVRECPAGARHAAEGVLVPAAAPQDSAKGPFVYVVKEDRPRMRPVKLGQRQGDLVVVEQGVKPGERVVINGQLGVMPGGKVMS